MVDSALVGRCGLYCGACSIFRAFKDNEEYLVRIARESNLKSELIRCNGCSNLSDSCWGQNCPILNCLKEKNYTFCHQCSSYENKSCEKYQELYNQYIERGEDIRANMNRIKAGETKEWLKEMDKTWRCPTCGYPISAWENACHHCGSAISVA